MIHQVKLFKNKYKEFFENSVFNGTMKNSVLMTHAVNFGQDSNFLFKCFYFGIGDIHQVGDKYFTCGKKLEDIININRARIFYPPLSHSILCTECGIKKSPFLIGNRPLNYPDLNNDEQFNKLCKELREQGYIECILKNKY